MSGPILLFILKVLISGLLVALISSLAKVFPKWAAFLTAIPLVTFLSVIWIYWEYRDLPMLERYLWNVFLWTLPMFIFFFAAIFLFRARVPFILSLFVSLLSLGIGVYFFQRWVPFKG